MPRMRKFRASLSCSLEASHQGDLEPATVCQTCYVRLQERVDLHGSRSAHGFEGSYQSDL